MQDANQHAPNRWSGMLLPTCTVLGLVLILLCNAAQRQTSHAQALSPAAPSIPQTSSESDAALVKAEGLSRAFRTAAQKALPAVVVIKACTSPVCPNCGRPHDLQEDGEGPPYGSYQKSLDILGSGFIVDARGIVLTNKHVIKGSRKLVVQTADGKQYPVQQASIDQEHDAAVLRIDAKAPLPCVSLGDSDKVEIGDWVLTIGCPLELAQTVSAGIISAKNRSLCAKHQARYLQTDAVVNPGSSGGPLVALNGAVIGITTAIASDDGGYQGIGFAVPANFVKTLLTQFSETASRQSIVNDANAR